MNSYGIVILTHNQQKQCEWIIESIDKQTTKPNKVVVVDNNSKKDYPDSITKRKDITFCKIRYDKKHDYRSLARNKGIELCNTDIITFLDGDIIPDYDYLETVKKFFSDNYHEKDILMTAREEAYTKSELKRRLNKLYDITGIIKKKRKIPVQLYIKYQSHFASFAFSIKRKTIQEAGLFPIEYDGWGFEDIDLAFRLEDLDSIVYIDSETKVYHITHPRPEHNPKNKETIRANAQRLWNKFREQRASNFLLKHMIHWDFEPIEIYNIIEEGNK